MAVYAVTNNVRCGSAHLVKIGFTSKAVDERMSQLARTGSPADLKLVAANPDGTREDEARIHRMLDGVGRRWFNEWFLFPDLADAREVVSSLGEPALMSDAVIQRLSSEVRTPATPPSLEAAAGRGLSPLIGIEARDSGVGRGWFGLRATLLYPDLGPRLHPDARLTWGGQRRLLASARSTSPRCLFLSGSAGEAELFARVAPTSYAADLRVLVDTSAVSYCELTFDGEELLELRLA